MKKTHPIYKYILEFYLTISIPLIYVANLYFITISPTLSVTENNRVISLIITILGLIIWIASYLNLGSSFGVLPGKKITVTTGLYQLFSHPMYLGISLAFAGLSIANRSKQGLLFTLFITVPLLYIRGVFEKQKLIKANN